MKLNIIINMKIINEYKADLISLHNQDTILTWKQYLFIFYYRTFYIFYTYCIVQTNTHSFEFISIGFLKILINNLTINKYFEFSYIQIIIILFLIAYLLVPFSILNDYIILRQVYIFSFFVNIIQLIIKQYKTSYQSNM